MEVYFYGTYERSAAGFTLMKYEAGRLIPISWEESALLPPEVDSFFSYDCFRILWQEIVSDKKKGMLLFPKPDHALLGIRNLQGLVSGREAYVNVVFWAALSEETILRKMLLWMLDDYRGFMTGLLGCLSVEAEGYQMNQEAYDTWLQCVSERTEEDWKDETEEKRIRVRKLTDRQFRPITERDLLRFGLCTSTWKEVQNYRFQEKIWKIPPISVFEGECFSAIFLAD